MNTHPLAKTTVRTRAELVRRVKELHQPVAAVAAALGCSTRTAYKWLARYRDHGTAGLVEGNSRPKCSPRTTSAELVARVLALRRKKLPGFQIARLTGLSTATISRILHRHGLANPDPVNALSWPADLADSPPPRLGQPRHDRAACSGLAL